MDNIKMILWDFDGVLMNSNAVRDLGFEKVLADFPPAQINELMIFHRANGGLSRYVKFRYFFENIRGEEISDTEIAGWAQEFSKIMKGLLVNPDLLIAETLDYVKKKHVEIPMHIVSGSDQDELRFLCQQLGIDKYFQTIFGSPTPKKELVKSILERHPHPLHQIVLVGDSVNDYEAAQDNGIHFMAYNNEVITNLSSAEINFL